MVVNLIISLFFTLLVSPSLGYPKDFTIFNLQDCVDCKLDLKNGDKVQALWYRGSNYELKDDTLVINKFKMSMFDPPMNDDTVISILNLKSLPERKHGKKDQTNTVPKGCNDDLFWHSNWTHQDSSCPYLVLKGSNFKTGKILASDDRAAECFLDGQKLTEPGPGSENMTTPLPPPKKCQLKFGKERFDVVVTTTRIFYNDGIHVWSDLTIQHGIKAQKIEEVDSIGWAGDLDGDGKLDLVVNCAKNRLTVECKRLYLSTYSKGPDLWGKAGTFEVYGD